MTLYAHRARREAKTSKVVWPKKPPQGEPARPVPGTTRARPMGAEVYEARLVEEPGGEWVETELYGEIHVAEGCRVFSRGGMPQFAVHQDDMEHWVAVTPAEAKRLEAGLAALAQPDVRPPA